MLLLALELCERGPQDTYRPLACRHIQGSCNEAMPAEATKNPCQLRNAIKATFMASIQLSLEVKNRPVMSYFCCRFGRASSAVKSLQSFG